MVDKLIDPDFKITQGCSRLSALMLRYFADSRLLPYSLRDLPAAMSDAFDAIEEAYEDKLSRFDPYFGGLCALLGGGVDILLTVMEATQG